MINVLCNTHVYITLHNTRGYCALLNCHLQGSLALVIDVYDDDDFFPLINGDDFVDQFWLTIPLSLNTASRVLTYNGRHRR